MKRLLPIALLIVGLLTGCEDAPDFGTDADASHETAEKSPTAAAVGLAAIRARGTLRVLTRNNGASYFVWHGHPRGFDYEMAELFAEKLGVRIEIIVPPNWGDLIPMLKDGSGDIAAAGMTITEERSQEIRFAKPYTLTHMRIVWGKGTRKVKTPEDLSGRSVHVRMNSAYYRRLESLSHLFESTGSKPIDIVIEGESLETEQILQEVAAGRLPYTLCDQHICLENRAYLPNLVVGPRVSDPQALAWAVHHDAADLAEAIDRFFDDMRRNGTFQDIFPRYYERATPAPRQKSRSPDIRHGPISPFDEHFKAAAKRYGVDWRLLAALAFQESRFDPKAESWTGGRGLFGLLPRTARQLGIKKLKNPRQAAMGAAAYLARLEAHFAGVMDADERMRMTVAAFNCGVGHVTDARLLATQRSLDANRWGSIATALRLLSRGEHAAKARHGYVRGGEVATYVEQVWNRYRAYRHSTGERDRE